MKLPNIFWNFFKKFSLRTFLLVAPFLEAKAVAKVRTIFETTKYFWNFFQNIFKNLSSLLSERYPFLIAGAKVTLIFYSPNIFTTFFAVIFDSNGHTAYYQHIIQQCFLRAIFLPLYIYKYRYRGLSEASTTAAYFDRREHKCNEEHKKYPNALVVYHKNHYICSSIAQYAVVIDGIAKATAVFV